MEELFQAFVASPNRRNFVAVRRQILADQRYDARCSGLAELAVLLDQGQFVKVLRRAEQMHALWCLSPKAHFLAGVAADQLGDAQTAEHRRQLMQACLRGLMSTGDGSRGRPFLVTYNSDQYDLLRALQLEPRSQRLVETGSKRLDVIDCKCGTDVWFDVTDQVGSAARTKRPLTARSRRRSPVGRPL